MVRKASRVWVERGSREDDQRREMLEERGRRADVAAGVLAGGRAVRLGCYGAVRVPEVRAGRAFRSEWVGGWRARPHSTAMICAIGLLIADDDGRQGRGRDEPETRQRRGRPVGGLGARLIVKEVEDVRPETELMLNCVRSRRTGCARGRVNHARPGIQSRLSVFVFIFLEF